MAANKHRYCWHPLDPEANRNMRVERAAVHARTRVGLMIRIRLGWFDFRRRVVVRYALGSQHVIGGLKCPESQVRT